MIQGIQSKCAVSRFSGMQKHNNTSNIKFSGMKAILDFKDDNGDINLGKVIRRGATGGIGIIALLTGLCGGIATNKSGEVSVIYSKLSGTTNKVKGEGVFLKVPIIEENLAFDGTQQTVSEPIAVQSSDNIPTTVDVTSTWTIDNNKLPGLQSGYVGTVINRSDEERAKSSIKNDRNEVLYRKIIIRDLQSILGKIAKLFKAEDMNDNRDKIEYYLNNGFTYKESDKADAKEIVIPNLSAELAKLGINIRFIVPDTDLPAEIEKKIQERAETALEQQTSDLKVQVATNKARASKEEGKGEADKETEKARGRAEAIRLEAAALRENPQILKLREIEAMKAAGDAGNSFFFVERGVPMPQIHIDRANSKPEKK